MPTPRKVAMLAEIKDRMSRASIAISADYSGLTVAQLTDLRRALRPADVDVKIVKNTLASMAATQANRPEMAELLSGPTAIAFGFGDPIAPVKILTEHLRTRRMTVWANRLRACRSLLPKYFQVGQKTHPCRHPQGKARSG